MNGFLQTNRNIAVVDRYRINQEKIRGKNDVFARVLGSVWRCGGWGVPYPSDTPAQLRLAAELKGTAFI